MVSTRKKKSQHKEQLSQLNEILNDFVIGNSTNAGAIRNELQNLKPMFVLIISKRVLTVKTVQVKIITSKTILTKKIGRRLIMTVVNHMHDAILTAMDNVVFLRVEMAVRSITGSSGQRPSSVVQNPDRRDFTGNAENTAVMSAD